jgi:putative photosynthetic complex assembly protein
MSMNVNTDDPRRIDRRDYKPGYKIQDRELIPRVLLRAMFGLVMAALALVTFAVATDRPKVGVPHDAPVIDTRSFLLDGDGVRWVRLSDPSGEVLLDLENGGFVAVVQNGLKRVRTLRGLPVEAEVQLTMFENGRMQMLDVETGWSVEIGSFGPQNRAVFERLFDL